MTTKNKKLVQKKAFQVPMYLLACLHGFKTALLKTLQRKLESQTTCTILRINLDSAKIQDQTSELNYLPPTHHQIFLKEKNLDQ